MTVGPKLATLTQIKEIAADYGVELTDVEAAEYQDLMRGQIASYRILEHLPERKLPVKYPRTPGYRPSSQENLFNGWYWKCDIAGAADGPLKGERIAVKDTVCVAGVPMMNGSQLLEGYIPEVDATIVTRMLDAGARIVGKANCEDFSFSGGGMTCSKGPVGNPYDPTLNPGASSSGSAVLIVTGQVDMAIGGDQAGSIRTPASWSGCYGMKPTYGLVPYTGCAMIEGTLDHVGPMASSAEGIARLLSVIAGYDENDPRQQGRVTPAHDTDYLPALKEGVRGKKIAILKEGFDHDGSDGMLPLNPEVGQCVREAISILKSLGADVEEISIPEHITAVHIWAAIALEGSSNFMLNGYGVGSNWLGWYNSSMAEHLARGIKSRPQDMPTTVMSVLIRGEYMRRFYNNRYYNMAQNQRHLVKNAYEKAFKDFDLVACPTVVALANKMSGVDDGPLATNASAMTSMKNTCVANLTGHPSISIPCGMRSGLPVGLMLTAREFDEASLIAASAAFETMGSWKAR